MNVPLLDFQLQYNQIRAKWSRFCAKSVNRRFLS